MTRHIRGILVCLTCAITLTATGVGFASPVVLTDGAGDAVLRRTDDGCDGPFDEMTQAIPDLVSIRLESFTPLAPHIDPYAGQADDNGEFVRIDIVFAGLVNPPGPIGYGDNSPEYAPGAYGPNPVLGYIEFDVDANENTGGEYDYPALRYLANVARFGGLPSEARFANRAAKGRESFDGDVETAPYYEASGEEFHLALLGEEVEDIDVVTEAPDGDPNVFEAGEVWQLDGKFFHKAHAYDDFAVLCGSGGGDYEPEVKIQFAHDTMTDETTISLVFPKTNVGGAKLISPSATPQNHDGCDQNQVSIKDVLRDLYVSAAFAEPHDQDEPEFRFLADWANQSDVDLYLDPAGWRVQALVGTAYLPVQVDNDEFIWTDCYPNPIVGDVNGDGLADEIDTTLIESYITNHDGESWYDVDGDGMNGSVALNDWGRRFSVCDVNYDGYVDALDAGGTVLVGDMNLDGAIDGRDVGPFTLALVDAAAYEMAFPGADADVIGDTNGDGAFDLDDLPGFLALLLGPQPEPLLGDMNGDKNLTVDDIPWFCLGLTKPGVYKGTHGVDPAERGDVNRDGVLDGRDIAHFIQCLSKP